jgi:hypothetical protein
MDEQTPDSASALHFQHVPLDAGILGPQVAKLVGADAAAPLRKMVANGLAPLAPRDLVVALYQLWVTNFDDLRETCSTTLSGLPDVVLQGAIGDFSLPSGTIDWLATRLVAKQGLLDILIRHSNVVDATLVHVAAHGGERICDTLAENQVRWRSCPAIVVALYGNRHCRQSVIHRVLETAVRSNIAVDLPMMDEIREALGSDQPAPERDGTFSAAVAGEEAWQKTEPANDGSESETDALAERAAAELLADDVDESELEEKTIALLAPQVEPEVKRARHAEIRQMGPMGKIRAALLGSAADRAILVRDTNKTVAMAAIKCPRVTDAEAVLYAADRSLTNDVIRYISNKREWIKLYAVKLNLVMNPKTPMSRSLSLMAYLSRRDIQKVSRSKNVPSALAKAAKRKLSEAA